MHPVRIARHFGRLALRRAFPTPEEAAWRRLIDYSETAAPQSRHHLRALELDLRFPDPSAIASQWHDMFVRQTLAVTFDTDTPRVLDCGAHIGLVSLWVKRQWPAARITAFEPDPVIADMLRENLHHNGAADVEVVEAAVWNRNGSVAFRAPGSDAGAIEAVAADTRGQSREVRSVRLRDWLNEPVDLLKLDIEGAELDVLDDSVEALGCVRRIHLEVHDFDAGRRLLPRCLLRLEEAGFIYALSDLGSAVWREGVRASGPFAHAVPSWVVCVRAWRAEP
jgi:FkbM family methyltransferase